MSQQASLPTYTPPAQAPPATGKPGERRRKILAAATNLGNLLPTGTVLAFQTLIPSFTAGGTCLLTHKYLTGVLIILLSATCFFSSFTDSFLDQNGKIHYGIVVPNGLHVFNGDHLYHDENTKKRIKNHLESYHLKIIDFVHALVSLLTFLMFALSDTNVQNCFWPKAGLNLKALFMNLPLAGAVFSTFFFSIFPTTRRGIGYADSASGRPNIDVIPVDNSNPNNK
ncbi:protein DMP10-like [Lycium barbarum]|uniref:protein DMP10-like n=1 Tax=Lycium barbarum TaxID=112863 RepID=UPI00293EBE80|nr:protein DMP10-like [Lycium barbarum]